MDKPKVFISHATEDKERFVLEFATKLRREAGVDAWVDSWEMLPGDSLVNKIFDEGIKEAVAVIIILSKSSVQKPWVREEINAAFIKRIEKNIKLISVVLDDCEVPEVLKSTLWEPITNLSAYKPSFDRIVASIYGLSANDRPSIGPQPSYVKAFVRAIDGLNNIDSLVLKISCEKILESGRNYLDPKIIFLNDGDSLPQYLEIEKSLNVIEIDGYIETTHTSSDSTFTVTAKGFEAYANTFIPDYQDKFDSVVSAIVNKQLYDNTEIQKELNEPQILVNFILDILEENEYFTQNHWGDGSTFIQNISPKLSRLLNVQNNPSKASLSL